MTRKSRNEQPSSGYTLLLVDDSVDYLQASQRLLEREGHLVLTATDGLSALEILRRTKVDVLLLDYFMPGMTGEEVVTELRKFNSFVQVILQTGYASERPPRELLARLDIQGYCDKSEGPEKLLLWTEVALKAAYTIQLLHKSRQGLRYILAATPDLHKIQPLADLLQGILVQVTGLLGAVHSFLALLPDGGVPRHAEGSEGCVAVMEDDTELIVRASTGRFEGHTSLERQLDDQRVRMVQQALRQGEILIQNNTTVVPLRVSDLTLGVIYLDRPAVLDQDIELLHVFANQAAVAIRNSQLYELATVDRLTGAYVRRFFEQWMLRELRTALRAHQPIALLMIDVDGMKGINDTAGHLAGDQALTVVGKTLRQAIRGSEIVGRYGGDEFAIILPQTSGNGAQLVAERILGLMRDAAVVGPDGQRLPLKASVGYAALEPHAMTATQIKQIATNSYFQGMAKTLIMAADQGLYRAKREGGARAYEGDATDWSTVQVSEAPAASDHERAEEPGA